MFFTFYKINCYWTIIPDISACTQFPVLRVEVQATINELCDYFTKFTEINQTWVFIKFIVN